MLILESIVFSYIAAYVIYNFVLSFMGKVHSSKRLPDVGKSNRIAVLIPSYKEDGIIYSVAKSASNHNYPKDFFDVYVIADSLQPETLLKLSDLPINVETVSFEVSTKTKALNEVFSRIKKAYDIAVILDADNIMKEGFLAKINDAYNAGYRAIQGQRTAKNNGTSLAVLDGISEAINNHVYRKGLNAVGLSSTLIGSGMAFDYNLLKGALLQIDAVGGFDRVLQIILTERGHKILYLEEAVVLDEKVEKPEVFQNQRKRWMSSQFVYLKRYFAKGFLGLLKLNFNYFNVTILSNIFLPRSIMLLLLPLLALAYVFFHEWLLLPQFSYGILFLFFVISIIISIPSSFYNKKLFKALISLPGAILIMVKSMFSLKGANKKFLHTPHSVVELPETQHEK